MGVISEEYFKRYVDEFNSNADKSNAVDHFYAPDAVFRNPFRGEFRGRDALVNFFNSGQGAGHEGIREILHIKNLLIVEVRIAAQLDIEWRCFAETNYLGPRKRGDIFWGRCAAFYWYTDRKFNYVDLYLNLVEQT